MTDSKVAEISRDEVGYGRRPGNAGDLAGISLGALKPRCMIGALVGNLASRSAMPRQEVAHSMDEDLWIHDALRRLRELGRERDELSSTLAQDGHHDESGRGAVRLAELNEEIAAVHASLQDKARDVESEDPDASGEDSSASTGLAGEQTEEDADWDAALAAAGIGASASKASSGSDTQLASESAAPDDSAGDTRPMAQAQVVEQDSPSPKADVDDELDAVFDAWVDDQPAAASVGSSARDSDSPAERGSDSSVDATMGGVLDEDVDEEAGVPDEVAGDSESITAKVAERALDFDDGDVDALFGDPAQGGEPEPVAVQPEPEPKPSTAKPVRVGQKTQLGLARPIVPPVPTVGHRRRDLRSLRKRLADPVPAAGLNVDRSGSGETPPQDAGPDASTAATMASATEPEEAAAQNDVEVESAQAPSSSSSPSAPDSEDGDEQSSAQRETEAGEPESGEPEAVDSAARSAALELEEGREAEAEAETSVEVDPAEAENIRVAAEAAEMARAQALAELEALDEELQSAREGVERVQTRREMLALEVEEANERAQQARELAERQQREAERLERYQREVEELESAVAAALVDVEVAERELEVQRELVESKITAVEESTRAAQEMAEDAEGRADATRRAAEEARVAADEAREVAERAAQSETEAREQGRAGLEPHEQELEQRRAQHDELQGLLTQLTQLGVEAIELEGDSAADTAQSEAISSEKSADSDLGGDETVEADADSAGGGRRRGPPHARGRGRGRRSRGGQTQTAEGTGSAPQSELGADSRLDAGDAAQASAGAAFAGGDTANFGHGDTQLGSNSTPDDQGWDQPKAEFGVGDDGLDDLDDYKPKRSAAGPLFLIVGLVAVVGVTAMFALGGGKSNPEAATPKAAAAAGADEAAPANVGEDPVKVGAPPEAAAKPSSDAVPEPAPVEPAVAPAKAADQPDAQPDAAQKGNRARNLRKQRKKQRAKKRRQRNRKRNQS